jgi:hypothetical protein
MLLSTLETYSSDGLHMQSIIDEDLDFKLLELFAVS